MPGRARLHAHRAAATGTACSGPDTTAVHATHLTDDDVAALAGTGVCLCPTTERDLADGIGPARALADAGSPLSLGSDSHAVIDILFEEARALEMHERLATERRGHFSRAELLAAATNHASLGWDDAGAHRGRPARRPGRVRTGQRRAPPASTRRSASSPPPPPTSPTWSRTAGIVVDGRHARCDVPASTWREALPGGDSHEHC